MYDKSVRKIPWVGYGVCFAYGFALLFEGLPAILFVIPFLLANVWARVLDKTREERDRALAMSLGGEALGAAAGALAVGFSEPTPVRWLFALVLAVVGAFFTRMLFSGSVQPVDPESRGVSCSASPVDPG